MNSFGDYLKGLRKAKGVHLREVGRNIGLSAGFISRLETGKKKDTLPIGKLMEIAEYYGVSKLEMCLAAIVDGCGCPCKMTSKIEKTINVECKRISCHSGVVLTGVAPHLTLDDIEILSL